MRCDHWLWVLALLCGCRTEPVPRQGARSAESAWSVAAPPARTREPSAAASSTAGVRQVAELFGISLATATQSSMRRALAEKGAALTGSSGGFDTYDSQRLLEGSKELELGYTPDGSLARAKYTFPSFMDTAQVARVAALVKQKYGSPAEAEGDVDLGEVSFRWLLDDGVLVAVRRGWPSTTTVLEYLHPVNAARLEEELSRQRAAQRRDSFRRQADAL